MATANAATGSTPQRSGAPWVQGALLACVPAMYVMTLIAVIPIIPKLLVVFAEVEGRELLVPMAVVLPVLALAFSSIPAGILGERIGRRRLLEISTALFAVTAILPFWLNSLPLILVARAVTGLALGAMMTCATGLTGDYFEGADRQKWLAVQGGVGGGVGVVISTVSGVLGDVNWRFPFLLLAVGFALLLALRLLPGPRALAQGVAESDAPVDAAANGPVPWASVSAILGLSVLSSLILFPPAYQLGLILQEKALGAATLTGLATAVLTVGTVAGAMGLALLKRLSAPAKVIVAFIAVAIGMLMLALPAHIGLIMVGAAVAGIGQGTIVPILSGWLLERSPAAARGRLVGFFMTAFYLAQFAAPLVASVVAGRSGGPAASMLVYAGASGITAVVIAVLAFRRPGLLARSAMAAA